MQIKGPKKDGEGVVFCKPTHAEALAFKESIEDGNIGGKKRNVLR